MTFKLGSLRGEMAAFHMSACHSSVFVVHPTSVEGDNCASTFTF